MFAQAEAGRCKRRLVTGAGTRAVRLRGCETRLVKTHLVFQASRNEDVVDGGEVPEHRGFGRGNRKGLGLRARGKRSRRDDLGSETEVRARL